ncbi:hypothetical protein Tcan_04749 [Toxocara canis]|uniref:Uncharacterized protein n=1 Tax=Toxocara canis TaxID=6265 RepID=A0A0B2VWW4_TOXCA|nr:hypothetical protein Tcan_04749 [Toxocara canis]
MRYGKIYFYDRMGNRVNDTRQEAIRGFDAFDVPNFRPPSDDSLTKTYGVGKKYDHLSPPAKISNRSSLETSPEMQITRPPFQTPPPEIHERRTPVVTPPPIRGVYPVETPPPMDNVTDSELLLGHLTRNNGLESTTAARYNEVFPEDPIPFSCVEETEAPPLSKYDESTKGLGGVADGINVCDIHSADDKTNYREREEEDLCERCKYEQRHMDAMNAELERRQHENIRTVERTQRYADDIAAKEAKFHVVEESRRSELEAHIDSVNEQLINQRLAFREPHFEEIPILGGSEERGGASKDDKLRYKEDLDRQMLSRQKRMLNERVGDIDDANRLNLAAAKALAQEREIRMAQEKHDRDQLKKFHSLQIQLNAQKRNTVDEPWWVQRPDEHGWREWRLRAHSSQLERNHRQQDSLQRLADFKRRLEQEDEQARNEQKLRYDALREKIHEQSELIRQRVEHARGIARPLNESVVDAWKREWKRNDQRYRILQEGEGRKSYLETIGLERVKRCRRCLRPIGTL